MGERLFVAKRVGEGLHGVWESGDGRWAEWTWAPPVEGKRHSCPQTVVWCDPIEQSADSDHSYYAWEVLVAILCEEVWEHVVEQGIHPAPEDLEPSPEEEAFLAAFFGE